MLEVAPRVASFVPPSPGGSARRARAGRLRGVAPAAIAALLFAASPAGAAGLATDRPDFTETPLAVRPGVIQLEGGIVYESSGVLGAYRLPELLIRYGLAPRVELRLGVPDYVRVDDSGDADHRMGEAVLGLKLQGGLSESRHGIALVPAVTLPTDPEDERRPALEVALTWALGLPHSASVAGLVGHAWHEAADRGPDVVTATVSLGRPLGERAGTFVEWAGDLPREGDATHLLHHGYTWMLRGRLQADVHGAIGLTRAAPDFVLGAGVSIQP